MKSEVTPELKKSLLETQKTEITEAIVYKRLAKLTKDPANKKILLQIAEDELRHYQIWKTYSGKDVHPSKRKIWLYSQIARLFWLTFALKLMEGGEHSAVFKYQDIGTILPQAVEIQREEEQHELHLIGMIDEKILHYLGSIVLGLNDALVELTGVLAGLTFGFQNTKMVAFSGLITGIAAAMSMAGSEYLSTKMENTTKVRPLWAALYTWIAYICTVIALIFPYFIFDNIYFALGVTIVIAILIIALFNFYSSVAQGHQFKRRFLEMVTISLGVALVSFWVGLLVKEVFGVEV